MGGSIDKKSIHFSGTREGGLMQFLKVAASAPGWHDGSGALAAAVAASAAGQRSRSKQSLTNKLRRLRHFPGR